MRFSNEGGLEGTAVAGEGANLSVQSHSLQLSNNSFISATAGTQGGPGNGGNINLNTDTLSLLGNSSIAANAFSGRGGNIAINTQGIFVAPDSKITASSDLGVSGVVEIRTPDTNPSLGLVALPQNFTDVTGLIASSCDRVRGNEFTVTGRGGLPENPMNSLRGQAVWQDLRGLESGERGQVQGHRNLGKLGAAHITKFTLKSSQFPLANSPLELVEANGWGVNAKGEVELLATTINSAPQSHWYLPPHCGN